MLADSVKCWLSYASFRTLGTLCTQLLLKFCTDQFETVQTFFVMVWRCACGFGIIANVIFVTFFIFWTAISLRLSVTLCIRSGMVRARTLKFYIPHQHEKLADPYIFGYLSVGVLLAELFPFFDLRIWFKQYLLSYATNIHIIYNMFSSRIWLLAWSFCMSLPDSYKMYNGGEW